MMGTNRKLLPAERRLRRMAQLAGSIPEAALRGLLTTLLLSDEGELFAELNKNFDKLVEDNTRRWAHSKEYATEGAFNDDD